MQYMNTMDLMMIGMSSLSFFMLFSSSVPNNLKALIFSSMWFPFSLGLYFYNKLTGLENGFVENVVYGVGFFSILYIIFSLILFYKKNKSKVQ